ncbi:hypothetical protein CsatB_012727 [Cannabis sativa]
MELPLDIFLYEILCRASLETVARCRLVSKEVNDATYESYFTQLFHKRANITSGIHILSQKRSNYYTNYISIHSSAKLSLRNFLPSNIRIEAATKQGLLLCIDRSSHIIPKYLVCKPTTQQWRTIPNPKTRFFTQKIMMLTIGSNPLRYKIIRFSSRNFGGDSIKYKSKIHLAFRCEVFDSKFWGWKLLEQTISLPSDYEESIDYRSMICISRYIYAFTTKKRLFVFDIENEKWEFVTLDLGEACINANYNDNISYQLVEYGGKLGLLCVFKDDDFMYHLLQLWTITKKSGTPWSWSLQKKDCFEIFEEPYATLVKFLDNHLAMTMGFYKIIVHDFMISISKTKVEINTMLNNQFFQVESDWLPIFFIMFIIN